MVGRLHPHVHVGQEAGAPGEEEPGLGAAHRGVPGALPAALLRRGAQVLPALPRALGPPRAAPLSSVVDRGVR